MTAYEYKTVILEQKTLGNNQSKEAPVLEETLNREARAGWRFHQSLRPSIVVGEPDRVILIFEREQD
jgi:hypothetical protein